MVGLLTFPISLFAQFPPHRDAVVIKGVYQGKNIYVQNRDSIFCTRGVFVNGDHTSTEFNSTAYEIDLNGFGFNIGDSLEVKIAHVTGCIPKILNVVVLIKEDVSISDFRVNQAGTLSFSSTGDMPPLKFKVQQRRWSKWITVSTLDAEKGLDTTNYVLDVNLHPGKNQFRIYRPNVDWKKVIVSDTAKVDYPVNGKPKLNFSGKLVRFRIETLIEVFDAFGNVVHRSKGLTLDCSKLKDGLYYINFENASGGINVKNGKPTLRKPIKDSIDPY